MGKNSKELYSSLVLDSYVKLIRERYPDILIDELMAYAGIENYELGDHSVWFTQDQVNRFHKKLSTVTDNIRIAREAGRFAAHPRCLGEVRGLILLQGGIYNAFRLIGKVARRLNRSSVYTTKVIGNRQIEVSVRPKTGVMEKEFQCQNRLGNFEGIADMFSHKDVKITHPECLFRDGEVCRYVISWKMSGLSVLNKIRWFSGVFGIGLYGLRFTGYAHLVSDMMLLWAVVVFFMLSWATEAAISYRLRKLSGKALESKEELLKQMDITAQNARVIVDIVHLLRSGIDAGDRYNRIAEITGTRLNYDRVMILTADEDEKELRYRGGYGFTEEESAFIEDYRISLDDPSTGVFYETYKEKKTVLVNNIDLLQKRSTSRSFRIAGIMNPKSFISCPIIIDDTAVGIIVAGNIETPKKLGRNDKHLMVGVTEQIASVFQKQQYELQREALKNEQQQLRKMESLGVLAGGIAHDFNNLLTPIVGYTDLCLRMAEGDEALSGYLNQVNSAALRARHLVSQILAFSRQENRECEPMELSPIVEEVVKLLKASLPSTIRFEVGIAPDTGIIKADPTRLHQVVMNLCTNAYHAMKETGGSLSVILENKTVTTGSLVDSLQLNPGRYAVLTVSDTGHGMDRETLQKVFEPYFTTKTKSGGTGLGLSITHAIIKQLGGHITADSRVGRGTVFTVYLPQSKRLEDSTAEPLQNPVRTGSEHIMVVDDEPHISELMKEMLEALGYRVTSHTDPLDALLEFRDAPGEFNLVITDMTMPGMSGMELATEIMDIIPQIPVILCTGYSEDISDKKALAKGARGFIEKPFSISKLAEMVRNVLDSSRERMALVDS